MRGTARVWPEEAYKEERHPGKGWAGGLWGGSGACAALAQETQAGPLEFLGRPGPQGPGVPSCLGSLRILGPQGPEGPQGLERPWALRCPGALRFLGGPGPQKKKTRAMSSRGIAKFRKIRIQYSQISKFKTNKFCKLESFTKRGAVYVYIVIKTSL